MKKTIKTVLIIFAGLLFFSCSSAPKNISYKRRVRTPVRTVKQNVRKPQTRELHKKEPEETENIYEKMVKAINKQCPVSISNTLRLDAAEYSKRHNEVRYIYTILNIEKAQFSPAELGAAKNASRLQVKEKLKNDTSLTQYRKDKIIMSCVYLDRNREQVFKISVNPSEY